MITNILMKLCNQLGNILLLNIRIGELIKTTDLLYLSINLTLQAFGKLHVS